MPKGEIESRLEEAEKMTILDIEKEIDEAEMNRHYNQILPAPKTKDQSLFDSVNIPARHPNRKPLILMKEPVKEEDNSEADCYLDWT